MTQDTSAEIGKCTTFANGNSSQAYTFTEKGESWDLVAFKLIANSTVVNATFKVTGGFLGGKAVANHRNDTGQGWGADGGNTPEYNNTTAFNQGDDLMLSLSSLGPLAARVSYGTGSNPTGVAVGDINSDGINETVVVNHNDNNITVYSVGAKGNLTYKAKYGTSSYPWDVEIGDVSNDGRKDIVVCTGDSCTCYVDVFTQTTSGTLNSKVSYQASSSASYSYFVDIADVNNDGRKDVVTTDLYDYYLQVFTQTTSGTLNAAVSYSLYYYPTGVDCGNLMTGTTGTEVAVFYEEYGSDPYLYVYQSSSGSLSGYNSFYLPPDGYWDDYGTNPHPVKCGDVNNDGKDDIVVGFSDWNGNYLSVFCQTSGGALGTQVDYTQSVTSPRAIDIGDINYDSKNEVVLVNDANNNIALYNQTTGNRLNSIRTMATGTNPQDVCVADLNGDNRMDVLTADRGVDQVSVFMQPWWFNGSFVSKTITAPAPNAHASIFGARPWWNITNNGELSSVFISNNGQSWTNVTSQKGQYLSFPSAGAGLWYRIYMNSTKASNSPVLNDICLEYDYGCDIKDIQIDVCSDGDTIEYSHDGYLNGSESVRDFSAILNNYLINHQDGKDANGYISIPVYMKWGGMGKLNLSDIQIKYDRPSFRPVLVDPAANAYTGSTPALKLTSSDPDNDTLLYVAQIAENSNFDPVSRTLDMTSSTSGWSKTSYGSGELAVYQTPNGQAFPSGKDYYWRASVFDGTLWSEWSAGAPFHIDSEPPVVSATSPMYSASNTFTVSWQGSDPTPGSGLAAAPYDIQVKVDDGQWTAWKSGTGDTSASYTGEAGHTYYFRARAIDIAGNRNIYSGGNGDTGTTIDPTAPSSQVLKLPEWTTSLQFIVQWEGNDGAGGSGITSYDVQVKLGTGLWTDWQTGTASTSAEFTATNGASCFFQARAKDKAGNVENYPGGDGDAKIKVDITAPTGAVEDDGAETPNAISLHANLKFTDAESSVVGYEYRAGTAANGTDLVPVTPTANAEVKVEGLNLSVGKSYYISARAKNAAGLWSPWVSSDGIRVSAGGNSASISYANGVQDDPNIVITLSGSGGAANVVDGDLEYRKAPFYRGELGSYSNWGEVGANGGDTGTVTFAGDRSYAYQFRYRIKTDLGAWSAYNEPTNLVRINQVPTVVIGTDQSVKLGKPITIDGSKSWDSDGDAIKDYNWDMGDGTKLTGDKATHTYKKAGVYTVTVTVSDGSLTASASIKVTVRKEAGGGGTSPGFEAVFGLAAVALALVLWRRRK